MRVRVEKVDVLGWTKSFIYERQIIYNPSMPMLMHRLLKIVGCLMLDKDGNFDLDGALLSSITSIPTNYCTRQRNLISFKSIVPI